MRSCPLVLPGRSFHPSLSLGSASLTDVPTVLAGTFAIALGVSQGTDHHVPTGQAVGGVEVAQVTLGMDVLGLNNLERVRKGIRILQGQESPLLTPPLPHFYLLTLPSFPLKHRHNFPRRNMAKTESAAQQGRHRD